MKVFILAVLILTGVGMTLAADIFLKRSGLTRVPDLLVGAALYGSVAIPVAAAFRLSEFGVLFVVWEAVMIVVGVAVATVFYNEAFTIHRCLAVAFAILALLLSYHR
jgi:multidrug transporter EmrE-like cation transporter